MLFLGVLGALVLRGASIAAVAAAIDAFAGVLYRFAALLLWTGVQMIRTRGSTSTPPGRASCAGSAARCP